MASIVARAALAAGTLAALAAAPAHAGNVGWSVAIQAPIAPGVAVGTVISNAGVVGAVVTPPVYVPPVYAPPPAYAPPVAYAPPLLVPRVVYGPVWVGGRWEHRRWHHRHPVYAPRAAWGHPYGAPARMPRREIRY
ncbi:MAG: hypothetical protein LKCHEGNO_02521 [Burkholderiaceae bacterium]|nr:hypothetical protein [Burkholderiaceae bacterium]